MDRDLTVREAAKRAGMTYQDFIVLVRNHVIPSYRVSNIYFIDKSDVDKFIEKRSKRILKEN